MNMKCFVLQAKVITAKITSCINNTQKVRYIFTNNNDDVWGFLT